MSGRPVRDIAVCLYDREEAMQHRFRSDAFEIYVDGRLYLWNHAKLPGKPVGKLVDDEGENRAVRAFLALYGGQAGVSVGAMRAHLRMSGFDGCWPTWADAEPGHLTKAGAQLWLRHLIALEGGAP